MSTHKGYAIIAILATATIAGIIPAFAANELPCPDCVESGYDKLAEYQKLLPIVVWTDKASYNQNEKILVSGHVKSPDASQQVSLKVTGPTGNVVKVDQLKFDNNGDFETKLDTSSPLWTKSGVYTIEVQYGSQNRSDKVQVQVIEIGQCDSSELAAKVGKETYCIPYSVSGATVVGATLDTKSKSMIININADEAGSLTLDIPRSVLDSKSGQQDDRFFVLVNGEENDLYNEESTTSDSRTVTIEFEAGVEEIEIIGTQIVPEFGAIAALVLAVAIISIIAVSAKTRLRLMPKY